MTDKPEIEITPEMVWAGQDQLCFCDDAFSLKTDLEWIVTSVYRAMEGVRERQNRDPAVTIRGVIEH